MTTDVWVTEGDVVVGSRDYFNVIIQTNQGEVEVNLSLLLRQLDLIERWRDNSPEYRESERNRAAQNARCGIANGPGLFDVSRGSL